MRLAVINIIENLKISNISPRIVRGWEEGSNGDIDVVLPLAYSNDLINLFIINIEMNGFKIVGHWSREYMEIFILCNKDFNECLKVDFFYGLGWNLKKSNSPHRDLYPILVDSDDRSFNSAITTFIHKVTYAGKLNNKDLLRLNNFKTEISQTLFLDLVVVENIILNRSVTLFNKFLFRKYFNDKEELFIVWFYKYIVTNIQLFFTNSCNFQWFLVYNSNNENNVRFVQKIFDLYQRSGILSSPKAIYCNNFLIFLRLFQSFKYTLKFVNNSSIFYIFLNVFRKIFSNINFSIIELNDLNKSVDYLSNVHEVILKERMRYSSIEKS